MAVNFYTQADDGYRWQLSIWEGIFKAQAQREMTDENGKRVFCLVGIPAFFDTAEKRIAFVESSHPKLWAEKWRMPVMEYHHPALSDSF
jgi:hypothetical protein